MEDDLDKLIKHTLNNIAESINFSEPDKLLNLYPPGNSEKLS